MTDAFRSIVKKKTSWEFPALRQDHQDPQGKSLHKRPLCSLQRSEGISIGDYISVLEFTVSHSDNKIDVLGSLLDENFQILTPLNYVK